jgi:2-iminobutanoate/2-iminopropanoate deaminase
VPKNKDPQDQQDPQDLEIEATGAMAADEEVVESVVPAPPVVLVIPGEGIHFTKVTASPLLAPGAIGPYSQAMKAGRLLNLTPQIPVDPKTGKLTQGSFKDRVRQVMKNVTTVCETIDGDMNRIVKLTVSLLTFDNNNFDVLNEVIKEFFKEPYPARATLIVPELPKGVDISIEAMLVFDKK